MEKTSKLTLKLIIILLPLIILFFTLYSISSTPFWFIHLEFSKSIRPIHPTYSKILYEIFLISVSAALFLLFYRHIPMQTIVSKLKTRRIQKLIITSSIICLIIVVLLPFGFLRGVSTVEIDNFINQNAGADLESFVSSIPAFRQEYIESSYSNEGEYLEIDQHIFNSIIDYQIMKIMGITCADLIIYQGWGSCGQVAIVIEQLLHEFGYEARRAKFIGRDHEWAEVKNDDGKWQIVDPEYITLGRALMDIEDLGSDPRFQDASGVEVRFRNGTVVDMSEEHGYR